MIKCMAIYPNRQSKEYIDKVKVSIKRAFEYGYNEIFTTLHLPELSFDDQLLSLELIAKECRKYHLELTVDIGGGYLKKITDDEIVINKLNKLEIDFIRLDYGYLLEDIKILYQRLHLKGFILNASIFYEDEFDKQYKELKQIDEKMAIRACHNYYVREETGLDELSALKQDQFINKYKLPIYYCIPSRINPRYPLYQGLCTLEKHRYMDLRDIICDLYLHFDLNAYMLADEWFNDDELQIIEKTLNDLTIKLNKVEDIKIKLFNTSKEEEKIIFKEHEFRLDSPACLLRSQSSRQMAEFASAIKPCNNIQRKRGYLTIDNILNQRYSGELQVILEDKSPKASCNVVGFISNDQDLVKLMRYKEGIKYRFIKEGK